MSTEWWQILIVCAVFVPLTVLIGRYLMWRRWDKERRECRQARRLGLTIHYAQTGTYGPVRIEIVEPPWGTREGIYQWPEKPGFSVKA